MKSPFAKFCYASADGPVVWCGVSPSCSFDFLSFLFEEVAPRVRDDEANEVFEAHLSGLASTGFARESLHEILAAHVPESRDWAIGEAVAEVFLAKEFGIAWPWNTERDKRNPAASLPGADLVGLLPDDGGWLFALGEVKCSSEDSYPPQLMSGRGGMIHQLDAIANNLTTLGQLLRWLLPRCKGTAHESAFNSAARRLLKSGNRSISLFGILIRDTAPDDRDLKSRGSALAKNLQEPTSCRLVALHLPCSIQELPRKISRGET